MPIPMKLGACDMSSSADMRVGRSVVDIRLNFDQIAEFLRLVTSFNETVTADPADQGSAGALFKITDVGTVDKMFADDAKITFGIEFRIEVLWHRLTLPKGLPEFAAQLKAFTAQIGTLDDGRPDWFAEYVPLN